MQPSTTKFYARWLTLTTRLLCTFLDDLSTNLDDAISLSVSFSFFSAILLTSHPFCVSFSPQFFRDPLSPCNDVEMDNWRVAVLGDGDVGKTALAVQVRGH